MENIIQETNEVEKSIEKQNLTRSIVDILETILLAVVMFIGINTLSARVRVDGFSMQPTLQDGEFVLVSKVSYKIWEPQHGDIIVFRYPNDPSQDYIKRIIGLPGDTVVVQNGNVIVNGTVLNEKYISETPLYEGNWKVPLNNLFVLGDNRNDSSDSHSWGVLPVENLIGKAVLVYWPFTDWNLIYHAPLTVGGG